MIIKFHRHIILSSIFFINLTINAQRIENIHFEQIGKQIIIYYDLLHTQPGQTYDVQVYYSTDGGKTFGGPLNQIIGDAGVNITGG